VSSINKTCNVLNFLEFLRVCTLLALPRLYLKTALRNHLHLPLERCTAHGKPPGGVVLTVLDKAS